MNFTRRNVMVMGAGTLVATSFVGLPAFASLTDDAITAFTGGAAVSEGGIDLTAPEIAENGNTVPVSVSAPGAVSIMLLASGNPTPSVATFNFGPLADIPVIGPILFTHDIILYLGIALVAGVWAVLKFTRAGLILRAVGESHDAAHALGYKVVRIRTLAIMFGGACAGIGGAYISLIRVPQWTEGMTAGVGWIALALVVFASWKPWRLLLGAYLFGGITQLQLNLQGAGVAIPVEYLAMSPYVITIIVLVILSADKSAAPASLGRTFHASH